MRSKRLLIPFLPLLLIAAKPVSTTTGFQFSTSHLEIQQPVEQQTPGWLLPCPLGELVCRYDQLLWVTNPTGMPWDVDDFIDRAGSGPLAGGATQSDALSFTADCDGGQCGPYRFVVVRASVPSASLQMTVAISPGKSGGTESTHVPTPVWNASTKAWDYYLCQRTPSYAMGDPRLQPIPNSNGGLGIPTSVVLTVTNAGKSLRSATVSWGLDPISSGVCPAS